MRKLILLALLATVFGAQASASAIKLKNGMIINGSIVGQTEYILNVKTSYGTISLNQREVDTIMPDLYRVLLKGGGEFVGTVLDLDEFNLSLKTDNGVVNLDAAQIASMVIYDYDEAEKQQKYVEKKMELEEQASAVKKADAASVAEAGSSISSTGLSFDSDLEKVFPSKPEVVQQEVKYNYRVDTDTAKTKPQEEVIPLTEEEKEIKRVEEEQDMTQSKKKDTGRNYFAVQAGGLTTDLKLNLSADGGNEEEDIGGTNAAFGVAYMRRINNRLWLGGGFSFGMLSKSSFEVPDVVRADISGQTYNIEALFNFYLNPKDKLRFYLTGGVGYSSLSVDKNSEKYQEINDVTHEMGWVAQETETLSSSGISGIFGVGLEYSIQDVNLGLEFRGRTMSLGDEFKGSGSISYFTTAKISWFF